jgi:hypothetical protein
MTPSNPAATCSATSPDNVYRWQQTNIPLRMDTGRPEGAEIVLQSLCPSAAGLIAETEIVSFP